VGAVAVAQTVLPVFALMAIGYLFGRSRVLDLTTLTEIVIYLAGPALVFRSLAEGGIDMDQVAVLAGGTAVLIIGVGMLCWIAGAILGFRLGQLYLPVMFMNAGNMLLPLSLFAYGSEGLSYAVVVFATAAFLQSSLGVAIASGRLRPGETLRLPYIYAAIAGLTAEAYGLHMPPIVARPISLLADLAVPLMLLSLGLRLRAVDVSAWRRPVAAAAGRFAGGYLVGWIFVLACGVTGLERSILLLASVMPAAVINFVFAEKYGNASGEVAGAVFASTVCSLVVVPLVLATSS